MDDEDDIRDESRPSSVRITVIVQNRYTFASGTVPGSRSRKEPTSRLPSLSTVACKAGTSRFPTTSRSNCATATTSSRARSEYRLSLKLARQQRCANGSRAHLIDQPKGERASRRGIYDDSSLTPEDSDR